MKFAAIIAATLATANAVKQWEYTTSEGNMQETVTDMTYRDVDLDEIQEQIEKWYGDTASPFISDHKNMVYQAALAEMEDKHGALLETCDEGTACRERYIKELRERITEIWRITLTNFKASIESAVIGTRDVVDGRWKELEQCQVDHPCCSVTEIFWMNNVKKVKQVRAEYSRFVMKWFEFDLRRIKIEHICPITIDYECAVMGPCWDGSPRDVANDCDCPVHRPPICPDTPCRNGMEHREPNTCKCISTFPSNAFNVYTEYVADPESIIITFDDLNGQQELEGYYIYLKEHRVECNESQSLINELMKCTVPLGTIMDTPYNYNYGDLVQAQIADVYDGLEETELSDLGGLAMIPELKTIIEFAGAWEQTFKQVTWASIADGTFQHATYEVVFDKMYIGETIVAGEGSDSIGDFYLRGTRDGLNVGFKKQYYNAPNQGENDWMQYEGTLDNDGNNIAGKWLSIEDGHKRVYTLNGVSYELYGQDPYHDNFNMFRYTYQTYA